jgi:hypothetical protein
MHHNSAQVIAIAKSSAYQVLSAAKHVPEDKRNWSPGGKAKSTLQILGHCTTFVQWLFDTVNKERMSHEEPTHVPGTIEKPKRS